MYLSFKGYKTYYEIHGQKSDKPAIILLHGGPGSTCEKLRSLLSSADKLGRQLIIYDQLGCGKSSLDLPRYLYSTDTYVEELANLISALDINSYYLLGHSWGGMLALLFTLKEERRGLRGLILSSTLSSTSLWAKEANRLITYLSIEDQRAIQEAIKKDDYTSLEYLLALYHYYKRYVSSNIKESDFMAKQLEASKHPNLPYELLWGKNEFTPTGTLKDYEVTPRLAEIKVPTLLLSGTDDESTPLINKVMYDNLICFKKWHLFSSYNHSSFIGNEEYIDVLNSFLSEVEK